MKPTIPTCAQKPIADLLSLLLLIGVPLSGGAAEQQRNTSDRSVLPLAESHYRGKIGRYLSASDQPVFPPMIAAPKGAPNVLLVLLDDVGFGQTSLFGGGIETPALQSLAGQGLSYNRFHTTALSSPTRAALLTGRNHHAVGAGRITEMASGYDGYNSMMPKSAATVAEILRQNGYATAMFGKNHNTPDWETSSAGPFDRWPTGLGFEYFYGLMGGETSQFEPTLYENTLPVPPKARPADYHLTSDLADRSIAWVRQVRAAAPDKPYFLYLAPGATHAPHHAPREWIDRFKGQFDNGWDDYRRLTLARQKQLGVVPQNTRLTPRPDGIPAWESLSAEQKKVYARMMEVFAGFTAHTDHEVGRVIDALRALPGGDNTLVIYLIGDNGASAEGGPQGSLNEMSIINARVESAAAMVSQLDELGSAKHYNHFPIGWAHAMNTPFQWYKMVASHLGATRNGLVISWPAGIKRQGEIRSQFHHVTDILPTILEAAGLPAPRVVNGVKQKPVDGVSMVYSFDQPAAASHRHTQYFELAGNRAVYHDGWMAGAKFFAISDFFTGKPVPMDPAKVSWELYNLDQDFSEASNLAASEPKRLAAMERRFWSEARRHKVLPLSLNTPEDMAGIYRPSYTRGHSSFSYPAGTRLPEGSAPNLKQQSFRVSAAVVVGSAAGSGVILAQGGRPGGLSLFVKNGRLHFDYNYLNEQHDLISSDQILPADTDTLGAEFHYDAADRPGAGGKVVLLANGRPIGEGRVARTMPSRFSMSETFDIGLDSGTAVSREYDSPATFTGKLKAVRLELLPTAGKPQ